MAEADEKRQRASPTEDFDPLKEEIAQRHSEEADVKFPNEDADDSSDAYVDDDPSGAVGDEEDFFKAPGELPYSITPPVNSRFMKREKRNRHSQGKGSPLRESKDRNKRGPKTVVNVIKERYESNPSFSGLSHVDSDADLERENSREQKEKKRKERDEKQKTMTNTRAHDRYVKRHSDDLTSAVDSTTALNIQTPVVPVKLEGSGRFLHLSTKSVLPVSPVSSDAIRAERRQASVVKDDCPRERLNFFRTFEALINMGSHGKKHKEQKEKERLPKRQISSDEKLWLNVIWIGLQAWQNGIPAQEQENLIYMEREKIPRVLDDIMSFRVEFSPSTDCGSAFTEAEQATGEIITNRNSSCSIETETSLADVSDTYHSMCLNSEMIAQQKEALKQVQKLLDRLDSCEQLFPTSKAFAQDYLLYKEEDFVRRLKSLYLWLNITQELCHKLKLLGKVLNVESVPGSVWPHIDFESPRESEFSQKIPLHRSSIPEIKTKESEDDEEEEEEEGDEVPEENCDQNPGDKRVCFDVESTETSRNASPSRGSSPHDIGSPTDMSTPLKAVHFNTSLSRASSEASLDEHNRLSMYRNYVDKGLKKVGLSKMLIRLRDILDRSLQRAKDALEKPKADFQHSDSVCKSPNEDIYIPMASSPSLDLLDKKAVPYTRSTSLTDYGACSEEFLSIGLPSFRPMYMFLVRVLLEVIHEAMKLRLEQLENPIGGPSFLSVRQLIRECKDVLAKAVLVKQYYQHMIAAVLDDQELANENSPMDLESFDDDMASMFKMYFEYLQKWLYTVQTLPEASRSLKNPLEEEWSFTKKICPHVIGGEAEAGKRFSTLAISLLKSIADFLESGVDECMTSLYDWNQQDDDETSSIDGDEDDEASESDNYDPRDRASKLRHSFQQTCRNFKNLFHEARERASKALGFAKLLRKDLEIAADFNIAVTTVELLKKLKETNHCRVIAPLSAGYLMFIPERITTQRRHVLQLLNVTCGREDITVSSDPATKDEGYLLMVRCGGGVDRKLECPLWTGSNIQVEPTAETAIALSHLQVEALLLVVIHSSQLTNQRREFQRLMGDTVELVNEQTSCHQVIAESLIELKESAIELRDKVASSVKQVEERWACDVAMEENEKNHMMKLYRETMLQAYNFGFEYMKEVTRLVSGETRHKLGHGLVRFAKDWMKFVSLKCERGRGMRPRWANQGLDFLIVACDPKILALLTQKEFEELQQSINDFISHLIGSAEKQQPWSPSHGGGLPMSRSASGDLAGSKLYHRLPSWPIVDHKMSRSTSSKSVGDPTTPQSAPAASTVYTRSKGKRPSDGLLEVDIHDGDDGGIVMDVHRRGRASSADSGTMNMFHYRPRDRTVTSITKLERERSQKLQQQRVIGRVTGRRSEVSYHINTRKVNFHWQKGNKIGEGQFGKVYSAVNMDTGELMAMKEMKFPSQDMQHYFKEIIDEIKIFEGINHQNLVKYYGVEVHRTEMLVFMEYCDRGTIEEVSRLGLPEDMIRVYTRELLKGVQILHENKIVHRDIKGANIFLTSKGCLKLGDFGCSVKLKNHTTMAGEVNALVGTTAYMAPEVITHNGREGHGRAADIWSVGCVVIEMASGKRPWHELESNYQIMFKVGMGETPPIPDNLGDEGKDFLSRCLEQNPEARSTASELRDHPFAKVYDGEDDAT